MKPEDTLCHCYQIPVRKVANYIRRERPQYASLVSRCLGAGTGCGWCVPLIQRLHAEIMAGGSEEAIPMNPQQAIILRANYRRTGVRRDAKEVSPEKEDTGR